MSDYDEDITGECDGEDDFDGEESDCSDSNGDSDLEEAEEECWPDAPAVLHVSSQGEAAEITQSAAHKMLQDAATFEVIPMPMVHYPQTNDGMKRTVVMWASKAYPDGYEWIDIVGDQQTVDRWNKAVNDLVEDKKGFLDADKWNDIRDAARSPEIREKMQASLAWLGWFHESKNNIGLALEILIAVLGDQGLSAIGVSKNYWPGTAGCSNYHKCADVRLEEHPDILV